MIRICHHCRQPLSAQDCHDPKVMRPVHKACHIARLATPTTKIAQRSRLAPSVARTLPSWNARQ